MEPLKVVLLGSIPTYPLLAKYVNGVVTTEPKVVSLEKKQVVHGTEYTLLLSSLLFIHVFPVRECCLMMMMLKLCYRSI